MAFEPSYDMTLACRGSAGSTPGSRFSIASKSVHRSGSTCQSGHCTASLVLYWPETWRPTQPAGGHTLRRIFDPIPTENREGSLQNII